jgi:hypothetical protein
MTGKIMSLREWGTSTIQALADAFLFSRRYATRGPTAAMPTTTDTDGSLQIATARQSRGMRYSPNTYGAGNPWRYEAARAPVG